MQGMTVLEVNGLSKRYPVDASPISRLLYLLFGQKAPQTKMVLENVNFRLRRGQCLGLIGNNGAGKSTLLKMIAGTIRPTSGELKVHGRVTAILELGAGFHPEFTGRENIRFNAQLIGITDAEIEALEPEIIEFSELKEAIDTPIKTYSSGMVVRLAFSLVTALEPDVLIVDEALAVGDQYFQKKCIDRINHFRDRGCTILFCSHSTYHVKAICDQAIWIEKGQVKMLGPAEDVITAYEADVPKLAVETQKGEAQKSVIDQMEALPHEVRLKAIDQENLEEGRKAKLVQMNVKQLGQGEIPELLSHDLEITVVAKVIGEECPQFAIMLEQAKGAGITVVGTQPDQSDPVNIGSNFWKVKLVFNDLPLHSGDYVLSAYLFDASGLVVYDEWLHYQYFRVKREYPFPGLVRLPYRWC
jgi:lipopolysaccharide transport system ATP-binding protein